MKVVLLQDVKALGKKGDVVEVRVPAGVQQLEILEISL